jgi:hypothetical protein
LTSSALPSATDSSGSEEPGTLRFSYLAKPCPHPRRGFFLGASSSAICAAAAASTACSVAFFSEEAALPAVL